MEDVERVLGVEVKAESVQFDGAFDSRVHSAQVDDEAAVDEDPDVVVATERKHLTSLVGEAHMHLRGEEEVVRTALLWNPLTIRPTQAIGAICAIEREVALAVEARDVGSRVVLELEQRVDADVDVWHVSVPIRERVARVQEAARVSADGLAVGAEPVFDHASGRFHAVADIRRLRIVE